MWREYAWERQVVRFKSTWIKVYAESLRLHNCGWTEQVEDLDSIVVNRQIDVGSREASMTENHSFSGKAKSGFVVSR